jgi:hypothetical protein
MKKLNLMSSLILVAAVVSNAAPAAIHKGSFMVTPFATYNSFSTKRHLKTAGGYGIGFGYATSQRFLVEAMVSSTQARQKRTPKKMNHIMQYGMNGYYYFGPFAKRWQPYVTAGLGIGHVDKPEGSAPNTQTNLNVGGGVSFFVTPTIAIRGGLAYVYTVTAGGRSDYNGNLGVSFLFGGKSAVAPTAKSKS